jgi:hypothetical protein
VSEIGYLEDGLDWTARMSVGGAPRVGAMSNDAGRRERGSCSGTVAALTEAISLQKKRKRGRKCAVKVRPSTLGLYVLRWIGSLDTPLFWPVTQKSPVQSHD